MERIAISTRAPALAQRALRGLADLGETAAIDARPRRLARGRGQAAEAGALAEVRLAFQQLEALEPTPLAFYAETLAAPRRAIYQVGLEART